MATISTREEYLKDKRTPCKYGFKCYQKNPTHHEKFKHPPKRTTNTKPDDKEDEIKTLEENKLKRNCDITTPPDESTEQEDKKIKLDNRITAPMPTADETTEDNLDIESCSSSDGSPGKIRSVVPDATANTEENSEEDEDFNINDLVDNISLVETKFLVKMPSDFYTFWEFCQEIQPNAPLQAFKEVNLLLVGPYDVLAGNFKKATSKTPDDYLIHWRYFYDPPEFQTIIKGDNTTGYHMGYFRDSPKELPVFVASNHAKKDCEIKPMGGNVFGAVNTYLENLKKICDPFKKLSVSKLQAKLKTKAEKLKIDLSPKTDNMRMRRTLAKTFHKAGMSVPYNKKTQLGYRELATSDAELKKLLAQISSASADQRQTYMSLLTPIITATNIANDECDFGTGLELGLDIFSSGVESLHSTVLHFLGTAYNLLEREEFAKIAEAHLKNRRKGTELSIL